jgi:hypothetical protein
MRCLAVVALTLCLISAARAATFSESFDEPGGFFEGGTDNIPSNPPSDWYVFNNSSPAGTTSWTDGPAAIGSGTFSPQSGSSFAQVGASSGMGVATISNWLITPVLSLNAGDVISFYTRTVSNPQFADRLQLDLSTNGSSTNVGTTATSVGDFTTTLLDINPDYQLTGPGSYPTTWTQYTIASPVTATGRLAFRYFVEDGGPMGDNSDTIGVDTFSVSPAVATPEPGALTLLAATTFWGLARRGTHRRHVAIASPAIC